MANETERVSGPVGQLDVALSRVEGATSMVLVCHPHPLFGGTMDNKVVTTVAQAFTRLGHSAIRFNYRGVGGSEGQFDDSQGEVADALAVARYAIGELGIDQIYLAGFSFGAYIAAKAALVLESEGLKVSGLLMVAPSILNSPFEQITPLRLSQGQPVVVVMGDADEVVPFEEVEAWVLGHGHQFEWQPMAGVSHFFHRNLVPLREAIMSAFQ